MTNLDSILKSRDVVTVPTKVCLVKAIILPVVMYGCENWTINKAEHQRIDAFELWCWRRLLMRVKEESEKAGLKLDFQRTKIMASGPSLHGEQMGKKWKQ